MVLALLSGCASQPAVEDRREVELPDWIAQGKQTWGNEKDGFFGVGTGEPAIENRLERELAAEEQARAAAMQEFEGWYVKWLEAKTTIDDQAASLGTRAAAKVRIIERWTGPDGRTFALAHLRLDLDAPPPTQ